MRRRIQIMPEHRRPTLRREMDLLDRSVESRCDYPEDLSLARVPETQGLGGP